MSRLRASLAALSLVAGAGLAVGTAAPASAATICEQYGSVVSGNYIIQNNRWGTSAQQCIETSGNGFRITQSGANNATNGAPAAYPSMLYGVHYTLRTPGTILPIRVTDSAFQGISTSVSMSYIDSGIWDAAYDIWFDPTPRTDGQNTGAELMVWLNHRGPIQPVGSKVGTFNGAGGTWDVWFGNIGWNVVSYVRTSGTSSISFNPSTFFSDMLNRGYAQSSWYMTSIQAGFEPWQGGVGLAVNSFSVNAGGGGGGGGGWNPPTTTTTTTTQQQGGGNNGGGNNGGGNNGGGGAKSCSASLKVVGSWQGGWQGEVTVTAGSAAISGWTTSWNFGNGASINQAWNAEVNTGSSSVTARNVSYNGSIGAGGSTTFGFIGNGSPSTPSLSCSAS